jgi:hypothetical protein
MKRENFRATASRAIDEGSRQRQMSAQRLASQFENGAAEFDLRSLERLGEAGLAAFLSSLGNQNPFPNWRESEPARHIQSSAVPAAGRDYGWSMLRSREPQWFVRAVVRGTAVGFAFVVIGSILIRFVESQDNDKHQGQEIPRPCASSRTARGMRRHDHQLFHHGASRSARSASSNALPAPICAPGADPARDRADPC